MRVITRKRLDDFKKTHPDSQSAIDAWYHIMDKTDFASFNDLRNTFPSADKVHNLTVFNMGGNRVRLVAAIHYNTKCVYIRHVMTHAEYDKEIWKKDLK